MEEPLLDAFRTTAAISKSRLFKDIVHILCFHQ